MARKILTDEELRMTEQWSVPLLAARANYLRSPGRAAMLKIEDIYTRVTGNPPHRSSICAVCDLDLLRTLAGWVDETRAAIREEKAAQKDAGAVSSTGKKLSGAAARSAAARKAKEAQGGDA